MSDFCKLLYRKLPKRANRVCFVISIYLEKYVKNHTLGCALISLAYN